MEIIIDPKFGDFLLADGKFVKPQAGLKNVVGVYLADGISYLSSTEAKKTWRKAKHYCNSYGGESPRASTLGYIYHRLDELNQFLTLAGLKPIPRACFWSRDRIIREEKVSQAIKIAIDFGKGGHGYLRIADSPILDDCHTCAVMCVTKLR